MARIEVKLNSAEVAKYLRSRSVQAKVDRVAKEGAEAAGPGYEASSYMGKRARASVRTATQAARRDNARNNTLIRVMGGRR